MSKIVGFMCSFGNVYRYAGWLFEYGCVNGPWPLCQDGELRKRAGRKFWRMWERFDKLSDEEKAAYCVHEGGCVPIVEEETP